MTDGIEITGGAGEFEAAVIAVVLDHIAEEERAAREGRTKADSGLPAWVRALDTDEDESPFWPPSFF
jgi:hypothetical protein